jgi:hypothetical protein
MDPLNWPFSAWVHSPYACDYLPSSQHLFLLGAHTWWVNEGVRNILCFCTTESESLKAALNKENFFLLNHRFAPAVFWPKHKVAYFRHRSTTSVTSVSEKNKKNTASFFWDILYNVTPISFGTCYIAWHHSRRCINLRSVTRIKRHVWFLWAHASIK